MKIVGKIREINRYPVKSFAGEQVDTCKIESYGLYGDRSLAFIDESKVGWDRFITARTIPAMLGYKAKLVGEVSENKFPNVLIESPTRHLFKWDKSLLTEIQSFSKTKISMASYTLTHSDLLAVDSASILILTDASLCKLEALWGNELDSRRFRANIVISIDDEQICENDWIGKRILLNDVKLRVDNFCERCSMITIDPETQKRDPSLLRTVVNEMSTNFGVYASVEKTGTIHVGDTVVLLQ